MAGQARGVSPRLEVTVRHSVVGGFALTFDFDERMVAAIKSRVPAAYRDYDARTHTWRVYRQHDVDQLRFATNGWATFVRAG